MKRQGWAASVGKVYLTRDGREVLLTNYSVVFTDRLEVDLAGTLVGSEPQDNSLPTLLDYNEKGNYIGSISGGDLRTGHPLDLVEAKLPAAWPVRVAPEVEDDAKGESNERAH